MVRDPKGLISEPARESGRSICRRTSPLLERLSPRCDPRPIEMAREFPTADFIGMDIVLPSLLKGGDKGGASIAAIPDNCSFEIGEV